jgi:hypothetical protein
MDDGLESDEPFAVLHLERGFLLQPTRLAVLGDDGELEGCLALLRAELIGVELGGGLVPVGSDELRPVLAEELLFRVAGEAAGLRVQVGEDAAHVGCIDDVARLLDHAAVAAFALAKGVAGVLALDGVGHLRGEEVHDPDVAVGVLDALGEALDGHDADGLAEVHERHAEPAHGRAGESHDAPFQAKLLVLLGLDEEWLPFLEDLAEEAALGGLARQGSAVELVNGVGDLEAALVFRDQGDLEVGGLDDLGKGVVDGVVEGGEILRLVEGLGHLLHGAFKALGAAAFADVADDGGVGDFLADGELADVEFDGDGGAVLLECLEFAGGVAGEGLVGMEVHEAAEEARAFPVLEHGDQGADVAAEDLVASIPEDPFGGVVIDEDPAVLVEVDDAVGGGIEDGVAAGLFEGEFDHAIADAVLEFQVGNLELRLDSANHSEKERGDEGGGVHPDQEQVLPVDRVEAAPIPGERAGLEVYDPGAEDEDGAEDEAKGGIAEDVSPAMLSVQDVEEVGNHGGVVGSMEGHQLSFQERPSARP